MGSVRRTPGLDASEIWLFHLEEALEGVGYLLGCTHVRAVTGRIHQDELAVRQALMHILSHLETSNDILLTLQNERSDGNLSDIGSVIR